MGVVDQRDQCINVIHGKSYDASPLFPRVCRVLVGLLRGSSRTPAHVTAAGGNIEVEQTMIHKMLHLSHGPAKSENHLGPTRRFVWRFFNCLMGIQIGGPVFGWFWGVVQER